MVRVVGRLVEIQHNRGPHDAGRLVELAVELAGSGGGPPMDAVQRIARLVAPHAGDPRGVFVEAVRDADLADRPPRGQLKTLQRHDVRIDQQEVRRGEHAVAAVQPEQVARLDHQRADLVVSAAIALQLIKQRVPAAAAEHGQLDALPVDLQTRRLVDEGPAGQQVFDQHPGHRQPAGVLQRNHHGHGIAHVGRVAVALPHGGKVLRSNAAPASGSPA